MGCGAGLRSWAANAPRPGRVACQAPNSMVPPGPEPNRAACCNDHTQHPAMHPDRISQHRTWGAWASKPSPSARACGQHDPRGRPRSPLTVTSRDPAQRCPDRLGQHDPRRGSDRRGPGGGAGLRTPLDRVCCLPGTDIAPGRRDRPSSGDPIACGATVSPRSRRSLPAGPRSRPPTAPTGEFGVSGATPPQPGMVGRAYPDAGAPRPLVRHPDHAVAPRRRP